jgi:transposase InsO family protein
MTWVQKHQVILDFIQPGQPVQNANIERFNRTYLEEVLDFYLCRSLTKLRLIIQRWISSYNQERPHDALNGRHRLPVDWHSYLISLLFAGPNYGVALRAKLLLPTVAVQRC